MTAGEILQRTRAGGIAEVELVASRRGAGVVRFTGLMDFERGITTLERTGERRPLWAELAGDEVGLTAGGDPEERVALPDWQGRDVGRSGVGLLALLEAVAEHEVPAGGGELPAGTPAPWAQAVVQLVTGIPLPRGRRAHALRVTPAADGRLAAVEVLERGVLRRGPVVTHALRLSAWR